jgi:acyl-CoA dehydrogenase
LGPNNYLGRAYQGVPISITVEGANILTRNMMIFGQGAMRCHPYVLKEIYASQMTDREEQLASFDEAVFGHIRFAVSNTFRSIWFGVTGGRLSSAPFKDETAKYYKSMQGYSANLALLTDVSMGVLGGSLKRRERLSARLGDILSNLYLGSAVLKKFDEQGRNHDDLVFVHWAMQDCLSKLEIALDDFLRNFPSAAVGMTMRALVMPFGRRYSAPSDALEHKIAHILQHPNKTRDRLGHGQYLTQEAGNLLGEMEETLINIVKCEPIFDRICKALGEKLPMTNLDTLADRALKAEIISKDEAVLMRKAEAGRLNTINVDDFDGQELLMSTSKKIKKPAVKRKATKTVNAE